jgi:hypothetical protein|eukprot:TRINITY_DN298_c2_g4_i1.p3 TRINITY_DN298_c2_g4~~TRINITY_DN298_c2_g4_i1.p3  ORF type:complete len:106 (-),score=58.01 TRINITY_DN298_c2_g4_i1:379-696(-)
MVKFESAVEETASLLTPRGGSGGGGDNGGGSGPGALLARAAALGAPALAAARSGLLGLGRCAWYAASSACVTVVPFVVLAALDEGAAQEARAAMVGGTQALSGGI